METRAMSAPISSAISTGSELRTPCPISEREHTIVTSPLGATHTNAFGASTPFGTGRVSVLCTPPSATLATARPAAPASTSPPARAESVTPKARLDIARSASAEQRSPRSRASETFSPSRP
jgi:hypothetical protein